jgi:hypothetical protein
VVERGVNTLAGALGVVLFGGSGGALPKLNAVNPNHSLKAPGKRPVSTIEPIKG